MAIRARGRIVGIAAVVLALAVAVPAPAWSMPATGMSVQDQIDRYLAAAPGGTQISPTEISYADATFVVTFVRPPTANLAATADCPSGWFCFYDGINYTYPRGKLSSCGWQDLADWGWNDRTESVHYNLSTGSVSYINHQTQPDHSDDVFLFSVSTTNRLDADVAPYRNMADHVYRYC